MRQRPDYLAHAVLGLGAALFALPVWVAFAGATETLVVKVYRDGVINLDLGGSAAQSVILMALIVGLTAIQFRYVGRRVTT